MKFTFLDAISSLIAIATYLGYFEIVIFSQRSFSNLPQPYLSTKMILTPNNLGNTVNKSVYFSEPEILSI